jgi:hypothetical protein
MDPVVNRAAATVGNTASSAAGDTAVAPKDGASQFDQIRAQLQQTADSLGIQLPQTAAAPPHVQSAGAVQSASAPAPAVGAKPDKARIEKNLEVSRYHIERIRDEIKADPSVGTLQKTITGKLTSIEHQYNQLDVTLSQVSPDASPQQWLRLQQMANSMNENINVLSKLVDSAASGVKTILQTQI